MSRPHHRGTLGFVGKAVSVRRQCLLLGIAHSGVSDLARPANHNQLAITRCADKLFNAWPFPGWRRRGLGPNEILFTERLWRSFEHNDTLLKCNAEDREAKPANWSGP
jgi:hypothetical protein